MPGFLSDQPLEANAIEKARLERLRGGLPLIDLTNSNPTRCGFLFPAEVLSGVCAGYMAARRYTPDSRGDPAARRAICDYYRSRSPCVELSEEQIFITASTSESYRLLFSLLCDPGDNVLVSQVSYPLYDLFAEDRGIELQGYVLDEDRGWAIDELSLQCAINARTRALMFVSPHNPTGAICSHALSAVAGAGLPLISDEVFAEFVHRGESAPPLGALYPELPVFHLNGISKMFALPDLKLGWIALNDRAMTKFGERLAHLNDAFLSCSPLIQSMLPAIFGESAAFRLAMTTRVSERVDEAVRMLKGCRDLQVQRPQGGAFILVKVLSDVEEDDLILGLIDAGVFVHPGYFYGCDSGSHIVISCIVPDEELRAGLAKILKFMSERA